MPRTHHPAIVRIRADLYVVAAEIERAERMAELLGRIRDYLGTDGGALAPQASAFVSEINRVLGTET